MQLWFALLVEPVVCCGALLKVAFMSRTLRCQQTRVTANQQEQYDVVKIRNKWAANVPGRPDATFKETILEIFCMIN